MGPHGMQGTGDAEVNRQKCFLQGTYSRAGELYHKQVITNPQNECHERDTQGAENTLGLGAGREPRAGSR